MATETEKRLALLEKRLAYLEAKMAVNARPSFPGKASSEASAVMEPLPTSAEAEGKIRVAKIVATPKRVAESFSMSETRADVGSSEILAGVAVLCFILGASYLVKLAMDHGWLDPARRLVLAACMGFSLIGAGFGLRRKDAAYAAFLPAAGAVVLYLAVYGGQLLYGLYGPLTAIALIGGVTGLTLGLFKEFPYAVYPIIALLGCYSVPVFTPSLDEHSWLLLYFLVWDLTFAAIAVMAKQRQLLFVAGYLALAAFSIAAGLAGTSAHGIADADAAVFLFAQMMVFLAFSVAYSVYHRTPLNSSEAWSALPFLLFFYGLEYDRISHLFPGMAPYVGLAWAGVILLLYLAVRKGLERGGLQAGPMISAYITIITLHAFYLEILPSWAAPWLGLFLIPAFGFLLTKPFGQRHFVVSFGLLLVLGLEFARTLFLWDSLHSSEAWPLNLGFGLMLLLCGVFFTRGRSADQSVSDSSIQVWAFATAHLQMLVGIARAVSAGTDTQDGIVSSVLWAAYGLAIIAAAWALRHTLLARSAVLVLLVAAAKAVFIDMAQVETVYRVVGFMTLGVFLYLAGWMMRQAGSWSETERA